MATAPPQIADYEMLRPIGRGAFGEVWLARAVTGQYRAVKVLRRDELPNQHAFEREFAGVVRYEPVSRTQRNLTHILHVGRAADGDTFWYVMELADDAHRCCPVPHQAGATPEPASAVRGGVPPHRLDVVPDSYEPCTLRAMLRARGRLPVHEWLRIALGITEATAYLHARSLVHRDIKPSNVIFIGGIPKLADIGLVTTMEEAPSFVGTAGYIPPDGPGTPAADIFALGKVLYEMATGRPVQDFPRLPEAFTTATDRKVLLDFNEIILRAADLDPRRRYASVKDLRSDLLLIEAGRSVRRWRGLERRLRFASRAGVVVAGIACLSIALGVWANLERVRALKAEQELAVRYVEQQRSLARATRLTGLPGQRTQALAIVREAALRTNSLALRNEAIAALALPDVSHLRTINGTNVAFDPLLLRYARSDDKGDIVVRSVTDDRPLALLTTKVDSEFSAAFAKPIALDFDATGERVCALGANRQLLIWRLGALPSNSASTRLAAHGTDALVPVPPRVIPLAFEPKSQLLVPKGLLAAVESSDGKIHLLDLEQGRELRRLEGDCHLSEIAFSPDSTRFATRKENVLRVHDFATEAIQQSFTNLTSFEGLVWHPDSRQIATWSGERALRLWNLETGNPSNVLRGNEAQVIGAAFEGTGRWLITTSWDNNTLLWDLALYEEALRLPGSGNQIQFSRDGTRFVWRIWNSRQWEVFELTPTPELIRFEQHPGLETPEGLRSLWSIAFLNDDVVVGAGEQGLTVWQPPLGYASALVQIGLERPLQARPGHELFTSGEQGLRRWPLQVGSANGALRLGPPERLSSSVPPRTTEFAVSTNGLGLAIVTTNRQLFVRTERNPLGWRELADKDVYVVAIDPGSRFVAATFRNGGVRIWDADSGSVIANLPCPLGRGCDVSPDGRWLAVATADAFLVWRVADWRLERRINRNAISGPVQGWSPDGEVLAVNDVDSTVRFLRAGDWSELGSIPSPVLLRQCCFSPDGTRLALAGEKSGVELWDLCRLRQRLAELGLDWGKTPGMPAQRSANGAPCNIQVATEP